MVPLTASYILPLKWSDDDDLHELTTYLRWLTTVIEEVIVVDGSPDPWFETHRAEWSEIVTHIPPDPLLAFRNGKVSGVITGVRRAANEAVVIADDDVRYDREGLARVVAGLEEHDLVRPQNYFEPHEWHTLWDTARTLLNRSGGADYPGTLGVRRSTFERTGGYDGDVLFENLELMRTIRAAGGTETSPLDLYVRRLPPDARHFLGQRVRQAYDEFALPARMALWLALGPIAAVAVRSGAFKSLAAGMGVSVLAAEVGRRKAGGARYFPAVASLCAPGWLLERSLCAWIALAQRAQRGGVVYGDDVIERSATPIKELERRFG